MKITGIDVGILHFALVVYDTEINKVLWCNLIDIKQTREYCNDPCCKLGHINCFADDLAHVYKKYRYCFETDLVLIERQPLGGHVAVEQLVFNEYRSISDLVSPSSMHCFHEINDLDYEARKVRVVEIAWNYLKDFEDFKNNERKHDMADAMCIILYQLHKIRIKEIEREVEERIKRDHEIFLENGGSKFIKKISEYKFTG
jgi:hypothetical protein